MEKSLLIKPAFETETFWKKILLILWGKKWRSFSLGNSSSKFQTLPDVLKKKSYNFLKKGEFFLGEGWEKSHTFFLKTQELKEIRPKILDSKKNITSLINLSNSEKDETKILVWKFR